MRSLGSSRGKNILGHPETLHGEDFSKTKPEHLRRYQKCFDNVFPRSDDLYMTRWSPFPFMVLNGTRKQSPYGVNANGSRPSQSSFPRIKPHIRSATGNRSSEEARYACALYCGSSEWTRSQRREKSKVLLHVMGKLLRMVPKFGIKGRALIKPLFPVAFSAWDF